MYHYHNIIITTKVQDNFVWKDVTTSIPTVTLPPTNKYRVLSVAKYIFVIFFSSAAVLMIVFSH